MTEITFTLPGKPVPWARARRRGKTYFMAPVVRRYHTALQRAAMVAIRDQMATGPVVVTVEAVLPVPPSWSKQKREDALRGLKRPTGRPDVDNYAKIVLDALNGIAWKDDAQVCELTATKRYGPNPHLTVTVR